MIRLLIAVILIISCGNKAQSSRKQYNLEGPYKRHGKCMFNMGHRLGGDFKTVPDNKLRSINKVRHLQTHECFKCWEFDINRAADRLIVFHDAKIDGTPTRDIFSGLIAAHHLDEIISYLQLVEIYKPICLDIKTIKDSDWTEVIGHARDLSRQYEVRFLTKENKKKAYAKQIEEVKALGYNFGFYK